MTPLHVLAYASAFRTAFLIALALLVATYL